MNHYEAIKKLFPLVLGPISDADMAIEGMILDRAYERQLSVLQEILPSTAVQTIGRYEKEYGIFPRSSNLQERRNAVVAKVIQRTSLKKGGLRRSLFISIAAALGYTINIIESSGLFRAGISKAGDKIYSSSVLWLMRVAVYGVSSAPDLEALFTEIRPPHLKLRFEYLP